MAELLTGKAAKASRQQKSQPNQYQAIFNELYRRFGVSNYKLIRLGQYALVLQFLADWKHACDEGVTSEVFLQGQLF